MDGNGRWAEARGLPRHAGHKEGVRPVRMCIEECARRGVGALTLFAFSSENWQAPERSRSRVSCSCSSMRWTARSTTCTRTRCALRFIGDRQALQRQTAVAHGGERRAHGREHRAQAAGGRELWRPLGHRAGGAATRGRGGQRRVARSTTSTKQRFARELQLGGRADPDLFIRTGGDHRISNFLLWNLAYTEMYVCDTLWPDFDVRASRGGARRRSPAASGASD